MPNAMENIYFVFKLNNKLNKDKFFIQFQEFHK